MIGRMNVKGEQKKYIERNKNINRGFRKLVVWQEAIELFNYVKIELDSLDKISYKVKAQIEDSILSVSSNIAEGYGRRHLKENIQFNNIALASLAENYSQVFSLFSSKDLNKIWFDEYDKKHYLLENKLISYNRSQIKQLKEKSDWRNDYMIRKIVEIYGAE